MQHALAAAQPVRRVVLDVDGVESRAAVDRAAAEVAPDVVVARAAADRVEAVARVDPVLAGTAVEHVVLPGVVARRELVAPEDVATGAAVERVVAVEAEQLVVARRAVVAPTTRLDRPVDPGHVRPARVADLAVAAGGVAAVAGLAEDAGAAMAVARI